MFTNNYSFKSLILSKYSFFLFQKLISADRFSPNLARHFVSANLNDESRVESPAGYDLSFTGMLASTPVIISSTPGLPGINFFRVLL